ncbi:MAG: hypothetical protein AMXMBFR84_24400 [Candidatus Hydrogenedentota bacterium]
MNARLGKIERLQTAQLEPSHIRVAIEEDEVRAGKEAYSEKNTQHEEHGHSAI